MNKRTIVISGINLFLVLIFINSIFALNNIDLCKKECRVDKTNVTTLCSNSFLECKNQCINNSNECLKAYNTNYSSCKKECALKSNNNEKSSCNSQCLRKFTVGKKECNSKSCLDSCNYNKKACDDETLFRFLDCSTNCKIIVSNKNITCENGKYSIGEAFLLGCQICKCNSNSKISCKNTNFCNFKDLNIEKSKCTSSGGFYQQLCNGPYFDIVCSQNYFCQCDGVNNYTCPTNYTCIHNFSSSLTRKSQTIEGWKTLLGFELGDIGICAKNPVLNSCGNSICENKFSDNNTNPETKYNCPIDCN